MKDKLGLEAVDTVTGFTGTVTGVCSYLHAPDSILLTAKSKDKSTPAKREWFDEKSIHFLQHGERDERQSIRYTIFDDESKDIDPERQEKLKELLAFLNGQD